MAAFRYGIILLVCSLASLAAAQTSTTQPPSCPALPPPADGSVDVVETTATYSCDPGFDLVGSAVRTCESGVWSGDEASCSPSVPVPTPTSTANSSMAATQSPSMSMAAGDGTTVAPGGSTVTAMMGSEGPATTPMGNGEGDGDGDGDGHGGDHGGDSGDGDNDTHKGDEDDDDMYDEGLTRGQVALTILATLLILMTITAFGALLWWKHHGTSYVKYDVAHA